MIARLAVTVDLCESLKSGLKTVSSLRENSREHSIVKRRFRVSLQSTASTCYKQH